VFRFENLTYFKLCREHLEKLLELKCETWINTHKTTIANLDDQVRWFESLDTDVHTPKSLILMVGLIGGEPAEEAANLLGVFKLFNIDYVNRSADVAWDVFLELRNCGYGKKLVCGGVRFCSEVLNLRRLDAEILEPNLASVKCALAAGFVQEGTRREAVFKSGTYVNSLIFGCLT